MLLDGPLGTGFCKLSELPNDARWNNHNALAGEDGRALVLVAYGSLGDSDYNLRHKEPPGMSCK